MSDPTGRLRIRRLTPDDWRSWREIRLTALADAPYAFGSSLAEEQAFDEATWRSRLSASNGTAAVAFLGAEAVGAIAGYTPEPTGPVLLVAAWVDARARGRGVGDALVAEVLAWAREQGRPRVELRVADGNDAARKLFLRHGFTPTGRREPLESNPAVGTEWLVFDLDQ